MKRAALVILATVLAALVVVAIPGPVDRCDPLESAACYR